MPAFVIVLSVLLVPQLARPPVAWTNPLVLQRAEPQVIWRRHANGPMSWHIWAPELHRIDGKWYVYFAAGRAEDIWAIRMYVLENVAADPFSGTWTEKGQIATKWESFSLDATTFVHGGARYLAWAQKDPAIRTRTSTWRGWTRRGRSPASRSA